MSQHASDSSKQDRLLFVEDIISDERFIKNEPKKDDEQELPTGGQRGHHVSKQLSSQTPAGDKPNETHDHRVRLLLLPILLKTAHPVPLMMATQVGHVLVVSLSVPANTKEIQREQLLAKKQEFASKLNKEMLALRKVSLLEPLKHLIWWLKGS